MQGRRYKGMLFITILSTNKRLKKRSPSHKPDQGQRAVEDEESDTELTISIRLGGRVESEKVLQGDAIVRSPCQVYWTRGKCHHQEPM